MLSPAASPAAAPAKLVLLLRSNYFDRYLSHIIEKGAFGARHGCRVGDAAPCLKQNSTTLAAATRREKLALVAAVRRFQRAYEDLRATIFAAAEKTKTHLAFVTYEDMLRDEKIVERQLLPFLGLPPEPLYSPTLKRSGELAKRDMIDNYDDVRGALELGGMKDLDLLADEAARDVEPRVVRLNCC